MGYGGKDDIIYPYTGMFNHFGSNIVKKYTRFGRTIKEAVNTFPYFNTHQINCISLKSGTLANMRAAVDAAINQGVWINFFGHHLTGTELSAADFASLCAYIASKGAAVKVVTYSEVREKYMRPVKLSGTQDTFLSCAAADTDNIVVAGSCSTATPITFTLATQPDVPRCLQWVLAHTNITAFTLDFTGINAKGLPVVETHTQADGWSGVTNEAFASITSIKMTARTGAGTGDTLNVGISDRLGLSKQIVSKVHVYKIKVGNTNKAVPTAISSIYGTVDCSTITANDNITIFYRSVE
jgi:hypothetical protein